MSTHQSIKAPGEGTQTLAQQDAPQAETTARVIRDLQVAADLVESGAFDLAGHAHGDAVADLIRIAGDLQSLIAELAQHRRK